MLFNEVECSVITGQRNMYYTGCRITTPPPPYPAVTFKRLRIIIKRVWHMVLA